MTANFFFVFFWSKFGPQSFLKEKFNHYVEHVREEIRGFTCYPVQTQLKKSRTTVLSQSEFFLFYLGIKCFIAPKAHHFRISFLLIVIALFNKLLLLTTLTIVNIWGLNTCQGLYWPMNYAPTYNLGSTYPSCFTVIPANGSQTYIPILSTWGHFSPLHLLKINSGAFKNTNVKNLDINDWDSPKASFWIPYF